MKVVNYKTKTVIFKYYHLSARARKSLMSQKIEPIDIRIKDICWDAKRNVDIELVLSEGYKIVFNFFNKDYLIIYNK